MATVCQSIGARFVTFSTDYVFDGEKGSPYVESDEPGPINAYGRSKLLGERLAFEANADSLIIRTSLLLSASHANFASKILHQLRTGHVSVVGNQWGNPTIVDELVSATLEALEVGQIGLLHLANAGTVSRYELALFVAETGGFGGSAVIRDDHASMGAALRPTCSTLATEIGHGITTDFRPGLARIIRSLG
jgi:dTDP-4-dehydrorhamnose reductase